MSRSTVLLLTMCRVILCLVNSSYSDNNGGPVSCICSGDCDSTDGWTVVQTKIKTKKAKESRRTKESIVGVDGIHKFVVNGNASAIAGNGAQH
jgi:hypothetical protein